MRFRRFLCALLSLALLMSLPVTAAASSPDHENSGDNGTVEISAMDALKTALTQDGDVKIKLSADIEYQAADFSEYCITVGQGTKVIDLNGYNITFDNRYFLYGIGTGTIESTMFLIPAGASVIFNNSTHSAPVRHGIVRQRNGELC